MLRLKLPRRRRPQQVAANAVPRVPLRLRITLAGAVTWTVFSSILLAGGVAGYYAFTVLYTNKLIDTWAIMFFELEQEGTRLADRLRATIETDAGPAAQADDPLRGGDIILDIGKNGRLEPVQGPITHDLEPRDLGFSGKVFSRALPDLTVAELAGERYLMSLEAGDDGGHDRLRLHKVGVSLFAAEMSLRTREDALTYLVTTEGKLIYSNSPTIRGLDYLQRPLVQRFISAPLTQGQLEFRNELGEACYGFFLEIQGSNLVLFSEVTRAKALASVVQVMWRYLSVLGGILALVILGLQVPLSKLIKPLRELAELASRFGQGDFSARATNAGFGEVSRLTGAFNNMAENIVARDLAIQRLMVEQAEKIRLEAELNIARGIQSNLLPQVELPSACGLEVKANYIPATECAGDWYSYHYDAATGETVVVLADVSGHGAGSSMFTAIIAGMFDQYCNSARGTWPLEEFAAAAHGVILRLGKGQWYATMVMARFRAGSEQLELLFCSHPPPFLHLPAAPADGSAQTRRIPGPSTPIGMNMDFQGYKIVVPFPKGSQLLMFTDGLLEARNPAGMQFGQRLIKKAFVPEAEGGGPILLGDASASVARVISSWKVFRDTQPADDDTCVVVVKAL